MWYDITVTGQEKYSIKQNKDEKSWYKKIRKNKILIRNI